MDSESFDLIITSPPYNLLNSSGPGMRKGISSKWKNASLRNGFTNHSDNLPHENYVAWQRSCLSEMMRLIPESGAIFYNHNWRVQNGLLQDRNDILSGFPVRQIIIWQRNGGFNFNRGYFLPTYQVIYMIAKKKFRLAPKKNGVGDVWKINHERNNPHPAPFPVELPRRIIDSTNAKKVLDPFCGSGNTGIAAIQLGREFVGIDNSLEYCELAKSRIEKSGSV